MSTIEVSCVIPVYNCERYVGEAIESVLTQSVLPGEVIVVDDGSTDDTAMVVRAFGRHVHLLAQENSGPSAARNCGLRAATGRYVTFLDADDLWHAEKTALQLSAFADDPQLKVCVAHVENFVSPDVPAELHAAEMAGRSEPMAGYVSACMMVPAEVFSIVGCFDESLKHTENSEWFQRARAHGLRDRMLPEVLVRRRLHAENRSKLFADESRAEFLQMLRAGLASRRTVGKGK